MRFFPKLCVRNYALLLSASAFQSISVNWCFNNKIIVWNAFQIMPQHINQIPIHLFLPGFLNYVSMK